MLLSPQSILSTTILSIFVIVVWALLKGANSFLKNKRIDIRVIVQRGLIYSILLCLVISSYLGLLYLSESFFDSFEEITTPIFAGIVMLTGILTIPSITKYFRRVTDKFFFKDHYDYPSAMESLSTVLNNHLQLEEMTQELISELGNILKPEFVEFEYHATKTKPQVGKRASKIMHAGGKVKKSMEIIVNARTRTIGTFHIGPKRSGDTYTAEDKKLLGTFSKQAAVAFEKAELYQELQKYSESLEDMVRARTKTLSEMQDQQRQLFDDISHALQTPLTVLKGGIDLLRRKNESEEIRVIESMEHGVDDLSRLIKDILELAKIDALPVKESDKVLSISELVKDVIEYVEIICQENGIRVVQLIEPDLLIMGNAKQIEEIIINLLSNAVRYTASSKERKITVNLARKATELELTIEDTGVGINPERISYIFDRFYRTEDVAAAGHGLGLAIVKRVVQKHSGSVHAESVLGSGTRMVVRLPLIPHEDITQSLPTQL